MRVRFVPLFLVFAGALSCATSASAFANSSETMVASVTPSKFGAAAGEPSADETAVATQPPRRLSALAGDDATAWDSANSLHQIVWRKRLVLKR